MNGDPFGLGADFWDAVQNRADRDSYPQQDPLKEARRLGRQWLRFQREVHRVWPDAA